MHHTLNSILLQPNWLQARTQVAGETVSHLLWFFGIVIATLLLKRPVSVLVAKISYVIASRFRNKGHAKMFRELTVRPFELLLQVCLFYLAVNQLSIVSDYLVFKHRRGSKLPDITIGNITDNVFLFLIIVFLTLIVSRFIDFAFRVLMHKAIEERDRNKEQLFPIVKEVVKILAWSIGFFWILGSVFNVNIPALITGLGIGGVAIALAAKETVENFFAAFTILTDKPFETGDTVRLGSIEGKVERMGFRSTRLRNADGSLYIIPNKKLVDENLENLTQRESRRVRLNVPVRYGVEAGKLRDLKTAIERMLEGVEHVTDPVDVTLESFQEQSFQLLISYYLPNELPDGIKSEAIRDKINCNVYELLKDHGAAQAIPIT